MCIKKYYQKCLMKILKSDLPIYTNFLIMKLISWFCYCKKLFTQISTCGEEFNQASLPEKEGFYNHLNMEDITDADYTHAEKNCKGF